jgi:hypothetical protein
MNGPEQGLLFELDLPMWTLDPGRPRYSILCLFPKITDSIHSRRILSYVSIFGTKMSQKTGAYGGGGPAMTVVSTEAQER